MTVLTMSEFQEFLAEFPEMEEFYDFSREALDYHFTYEDYDDEE